MKKIFTFLLAVLGISVASATDYTDKLYVTLNGSEVFESDATITLTEQEDGLYTIVVNQFSFSGLLVGDVNIVDIEATEDEDGTIYFETEQQATITNGDMIATLVGGVLDVTLREGSCLKGDKLYLVLRLPISVAATGMDFDVKASFGTGDYQIGNSSFEEFHSVSLTYSSYSTSCDEPNHWHSLMSADGTSSFLVYMAASSPSCFTSDETRPNSNGTSSVLVTSRSIAGITANGTITSGRMYVGSASASDAANHAYNDMSETEVDANGDPYYAALCGRPDSLTAWVKFKQETPLEDYPYAAINAVINDGNYYQNPEGDDTYTNVVAKASAKIETEDFEWQRVSVPFDYESYEDYGAEPGAILVTITTNAEAGQGSVDSLFVDDLSLIYNNDLTSLTIKGNEVELVEDQTEYELSIDGDVSEDDIEVETDGQGAIVEKTIEVTDDGLTVYLSIISGDYCNWTDYTITINGATTGIDEVSTVSESEAVEVYDLNGRRVKEVGTNGVYVVRSTDGKTYKVAK